MINSSRFTFAVTLTPDKTDGGWVVTSRDLPEVITQGETIEAALIEAADCLEEAVAARIDDKKNIPMPSSTLPDEYLVSVPLQTALKATLYLAMQDAQITQVELAKKLRVDEKEVRRILDPHHPTKLPKIERTLHILGKQIELRFIG